MTALFWVGYGFGIAHNSKAEETLKPSRLPKELTEVLDWLPQDTETVLVARGPFVIPETDEDLPKTGNSKDEMNLKTLWLFRINALGPLGIDKGKLDKPMSGQKVTLAVRGSRKFGKPTGIPGLIRYESCSITVFADDLNGAMIEALKTLEQDAIKVHRVDDERILQFSESEGWSDALWNFYVATSGKRVLLVGTDLDFISDVLRRIKKAGTGQALPVDLREWSELDPKAECWAIRHYDKKSGEGDFTSPLMKENFMECADPNAEGLVAYLDPKEPRKARVKYLSSNADATKFMKKVWKEDPEHDLKAKVSRGSPGVVEISLKLENEDAMTTFSFTLDWWLGHGVLP